MAAMAPAVVPRCRCAAACLFQFEDEVRCLKCGRGPTLRLARPPGKADRSRPGRGDDRGANGEG